MNKALLFVPWAILVGGQSWAAPFDWAVAFEMSDFSEDAGDPEAGGTYLRFMEERIKPAMDRLATEGYPMCDSATVGEAFSAADTKVQRKVIRNFGSIKNVQAIVDRLVDRLDGRNVTLATLPKEIRAVAPGVANYDLANFLGLACGGGVKITFHEGNVALNVHYDVTEEKSGRSYGIGPTRGANDASDKDYLDDLQDYSRVSGENLPAFYRAMMEALLASDGSGYSAVEPEGQTVLTDFLAVYTAEQARNLMDGYLSPHWDAALMEVTLLAGFHAGQSRLKLYYYDPAQGTTTFTDRTRRQTSCGNPTQAKSASLSDYWQFSRNITDPANCRRSGINITKREFRLLGSKITSYLRKDHRAVYDRVKASMKIAGQPTNLYYSLSQYLIGQNAPRRLTGAQVEAITAAWAEMLTVVNQNADAISAAIEAAGG